MASLAPQRERARRRSVRPNLTDYLPLVQREYLEYPTLKLTRDQVRRLWNLDPETCDALLKALIDAHFLTRTCTGAFVRADGIGR